MNAYERDDWMIKQPNIELVKKYLEKDDPVYFDFKLMEKSFVGLSDELERELTYKGQQLRNKVPDPDCCELAMSIMCLLLEKNGISVKGFEGRHIELNNDVTIETDTANSFISLYKGALMQNIPDYSALCKKYEIEGSFTKNYEKIYAHRDEFSLVGHNDELLMLFKQFAYLTHTIGNFIVGPEGFNCADKKSKSNLFSPRLWSNFDRIDKFLERVAMGKTYASWEKWFSENCFSTYNNYFYKEIVCKKGKDAVDLSQSKVIDLGENIVKRVTLINEIICRRGEAMIRDLREYLKANYE